MTTAGHRLSAEELSAVFRWLTAAGYALAGPLTAEPIAGGRSNLTYRLTDGTAQWVMRTPPRAGLTPSAHDVAREYRVTAALAGTDVPVAPVVALCADTSVIGVPFAVTEFVRGRTIRTRTELEALDQTTVDSVTARLVDTLVALHRVDYISVGLAGFGRPDSYAERQVSRWGRQWETVGTPALRTLAADVRSRLVAALPAQLRVGVVHGDYRIDNTILSIEEGTPPSVAAVVDWELSTIGDPVADVATMCAYRQPVFDLIIGSPGAWTSLRLPGPDELAAAYEASSGVTLAAWDFHLALAYFKIGVIAAGIDHRFRAGAASGAGFDTAGQAVEIYFELALDRLKARRLSPLPEN